MPKEEYYDCLQLHRYILDAEDENGDFDEDTDEEYFLYKGIKHTKKRAYSKKYEKKHKTFTVVNGIYRKTKTGICYKPNKHNRILVERRKKHYPSKFIKHSNYFWHVETPYDCIQKHSNEHNRKQINLIYPTNKYTTFKDKKYKHQTKAEKCVTLCTKCVKFKVIRNNKTSKHSKKKQSNCIYPDALYSTTVVLTDSTNEQNECKCNQVHNTYTQFNNEEKLLPKTQEQDDYCIYPALYSTILVLNDSEHQNECKCYQVYTYTQVKKEQQKLLTKKQKKQKKREQKKQKETEKTKKQKNRKKNKKPKKEQKQK